MNEVNSNTNKVSTFIKRSISTIILWGIVLVGIFCLPPLGSKLVILLCLSLLAYGGLKEFYELAQKQCFPVATHLGIIGGIILIVSTWCYLSGVFYQQLQPAKANDFETGFIILFVLGLTVYGLLFTPSRNIVLNISITFFGLMYIAWLLNFFQKIVFFPRANGLLYLLYFIAITKLSDTGAYLIGSLLGKHKMCPTISPGKTWEGLGGAILFSTIGSLLFSKFASTHLTGMNSIHALILGIGLGIAAVIGDLIESFFKRAAGVKDSGSLFPGIGGVLDVLDSLLFNAPLMYLYLRHILTD